MKRMGLFLLVSVVVWVGVLAGGCSVNVNRENFAGYPQQVEFGAAPGQRVYVQKPGYYAVHYAQPDALLTDEVAVEGAVVVMEEEAIAIFRGTPRRTLPSDSSTSPVYTLQSGSTLAIPTGKVFVRLAESVPIESRQDAIAAAGYEIVDRPAYAPHAAWVQARSGNIADALRQLSQLTAIPDVENVEPQMLTQRALR